MKIIKKGRMPDGTEIQLENWNIDYEFIPPSSTIAAYSKSKMTLEGAFAPKAGELMRFQFEFHDAAETETAYNALLAGEKILSDYKEKLYYQKHALCL